VANVRKKLARNPLGTRAAAPEFLPHRIKEYVQMPAKSKSQQMAAGAALAAKKGEKKKSELKGASRSMFDSMSKKELEELASTDRKKLPEKKKS
jgi:hypothetical protein